MTRAPARPVGDRGLLIDDETPAALARAIRRAAQDRGLSLREVVPTARTVLVEVADPADRPALLAVLAGLTKSASYSAAHPPAESVVEPLTLPVRFDGVDLDTVARRCSMSVEALIAMVTAARLTAAFAGFAPGFAYLTGLDPRLRLPRRDQPRTQVPAGSLAIADSYAAVYPIPSPGGWHLLGCTKLVMFDPYRDPPALISPGRAVRIEAVR